MKRHLPEYACEAIGLGLFMISAAVFTTLVEHPGSPVRQAIGEPLVRRLIVGVAMALTAMTLVYSPLGRRSGAHMNPALTFAFYRLGKIAPKDALAYTAAQFVGAFAGLLAAAALVGPAIAHGSVRYLATTPGPAGQAAALVAEAAISFALMTTVLRVSNHPRLAPLTGVCAAFVVAVSITFEAPVSGMSMNPARSFAPALFAGTERSLWIYFLAPPLGMLAASEAFVATHGQRSVLCAKLNHTDRQRCIFRCGYAASTTQETKYVQS